MSSSLLFGAFALLFGLFTLGMRFVAPESRLFSKLGPMKERYGERAGLAIHVVAYTLMPMVVGATLLARALGGS